MSSRSSRSSGSSQTEDRTTATASASSDGSSSAPEPESGGALITPVGYIPQGVLSHLTEPSKGTHVETSPQGRYLRFEEKLGSGQYKDVYRAYDTSEGIEVAWNTVNIKLLPKDEKKRIMNEVRLLQNLEHKNLVQFHGSWVNREKEQVSSSFLGKQLRGGILSVGTNVGCVWRRARFALRFASPSETWKSCKQRAALGRSSWSVFDDLGHSEGLGIYGSRSACPLRGN